MSLATLVDGRRRCFSAPSVPDLAGRFPTWLQKYGQALLQPSRSRPFSSQARKRSDARFGSDLVAKVENRTTLKISRKLIFGLLCCCVAFQRHYGDPWSILGETIRSLTSPRVRRIGGSKNFRSPPQKDFCNNIGPSADMTTWPRNAALGIGRSATNLAHCLRRRFGRRRANQLRFSGSRFARLIFRLQKSHARKRQFAEAIQADLGRPVPLAKIFRLSRRANQRHWVRPSRLDKRGVRVVTNVEVGCGGRESAARRAAWSRTAKPCGPDAPTLALSFRRKWFPRKRRWQKSPVTGESAR